MNYYHTFLKPIITRPENPNFTSSNRQQLFNSLCSELGYSKPKKSSDSDNPFQKYNINKLSASEYSPSYNTQKQKITSEFVSNVPQFQKPTSTLNYSLFSKGASSEILDRFHSRYPFETPLNKYKTNSISYYFLPRPSSINQRKTLVLEIDETLVYSTLDSPKGLYDKEIVISYDGEPVKIFVMKRPYLMQFLNHMSELYEVVIYTAGIKQYAENIVKYIDVNNNIKFILTREECKTDDGKNYVKEIKRIGREMSATVVVDCHAGVYANYPYNTVKIPKWKGERNDCVLRDIEAFLVELATIDDVRNRIPEINEEIQKKIK